MKFNYLSAAAILVAGITMQAQAADSANIDFAGNITTSTCDVSIDGVSASKEIKLADITVPAMKAATSSPAQKASFEITVKNCAQAPAGGKVKGQFSTAGGFNSTTQALLNTDASGDKDAGFQVEDTAPVPLSILNLHRHSLKQLTMQPMVPYLTIP